MENLLKMQDAVRESSMALGQACNVTCEHLLLHEAAYIFGQVQNMMKANKRLDEYLGSVREGKILDRAYQDR